MATITFEIKDIELNGKPDIEVKCSSFSDNDSLRVKAYLIATSMLVKETFQNKHFHNVVNQSIEMNKQTH